MDNIRRLTDKEVDEVEDGFYKRIFDLKPEDLEVAKSSLIRRMAFLEIHKIAERVYRDELKKLSVRMEQFDYQIEKLAEEIIRKREGR